MDTTPKRGALAPLGGVEPHATLLQIPAAGQALYKMMTVENLLSSVSESYLYFNRVDAYKDLHDGQQLPGDRQLSVGSKFQNAPEYSAADYYDQSRSRTYACCFSLEESSYIWENYANEGSNGKTCITFDFEKLRIRLNKTLGADATALQYQGKQCRQIFSINFGLVKYVKWDSHRANEEHLANPIEYAFLKGEHFSQEKELRVALSAPGIGQFVLLDGTVMDFPAGLHMPFDFKAAISDGTIKSISLGSNVDSSLLNEKLATLGITSV